MIRVTVELVSAINPARSKVLGVAVISNDGEKTAVKPARGNYNFALSMRAPFTNRVWKSGSIEEFPRKRLGGWDLLYRVLRAAVGERNP